MPIYEYECSSCNRIIEKWQSLSESVLTECPECAGSLKKLISASSFQLKGGGWYADGYSSSASGCAGKTCAAPCSSSASAAPAAPAACGADSKASCGCA